MAGYNEDDRVVTDVTLSTVMGEAFHNVKVVIIKDPSLVFGSLVTLSKANALKGLHMVYRAIRFGIRFISYSDIC